MTAPICWLSILVCPATPTTRLPGPGFLSTTQTIGSQRRSLTFAAWGAPFAWVVGPGSRPLALEELLVRHGLRVGDCDVGMAMELVDLPAAWEVPAGVEIRRVRTPAELADFAAVNAANWEPPDPAVAKFYMGAAPLLLVPDCPMRLFVGYRDGIAVAASELFLSRGTGGLYGIATRARFRRQGIGTALTWAAADEARRSGVRSATLQASQDGQGVYARLGFRVCCQSAEYQ